jgi:hypothetical protein
VQHPLFFHALQRLLDNPRKYEVWRDVGELLDATKYADDLNLQDTSDADEPTESDREFIDNSDEATPSDKDFIASDSEQIPVNNSNDENSSWEFEQDV